MKMFALEKIDLHVGKLINMLDLLTVGQKKLRCPHVARQQQLSIDICCPRLTSAANPPAAAAVAVDRRGRQTDGRTDGQTNNRFTTLAAYCADRVIHRCKNVFTFFLSWSRFFTFFNVFYFPNVFLYLKNVGKVQSGKQINKKHFQNNSNEIQWVHK